MKKLFIILLILLVTACNSTTTLDPKISSETPDNLVLAAYLTDSNNPLTITSKHNEQVNFLLYDSLYKITEKFEIQNNLANNFRIENEGKTVIIAIKPNISFHDKSPLTAYDIEATINYILRNGGYYQYNLRNVNSVSAINDYEIQLNLSYLTPNIKMQLTFPIICKKSLVSANNFQINGTGPYKLSSETRGKQITIEQNKEYHNEFQTKHNLININLMPDKVTSNALFTSGILDLFFASFYNDELKGVAKTAYDKTDFTTDEYLFIGFNFNRPVLQIKEVRKALAGVINKEKINQDLLLSHGVPTNLPIIPNLWASNKNTETEKTQLNPNLEQHKKALTDLGFSDINGDGILERNIEDKKEELKLELLVDDSDLKKSIANEIADNLKELGVLVEVKSVKKEIYLSAYEKREYDLCLIDTNVGYDLDLFEFLSPRGTFSTPIQFDYENSLTKLAQATEPELKIPTYMRICDEFAENMPHIPISFIKSTLYYSAELKNDNQLFPNNLYYNIVKSE